MKYFVDIDGERVEVDLDGETARVNGGPPRHAHLADVPGSAVRLVTIDGAMHRVGARRDGARGRYVLRIDGRRHQVEALDERARAIRDLSAASSAASGPQPLRAPMPGLIVKLFVAVGDRVDAAQPVIAMEAMKMENELRAPAAGTVKAVHAKIGTAVEKGALLVEFD